MSDRIGPRPDDPSFPIPPSRRFRAGRAAPFGIILLCFLLPFADVSCSEERSFDSAEEVVSLTGVHLVVGSEQRFPASVGDPFGLEESNTDLGSAEEARTPPESFAVLAFVAALVGFALSFRGDRWGSLGPVIAGVIGFVSTALLGMSPTLRALGLVDVRLRVGYWLTLALFVAATAWSWIGRGGRIRTGDLVLPKHAR